MQKLLKKLADNLQDDNLKHKQLWENLKFNEEIMKIYGNMVDSAIRRYTYGFPNYNPSGTDIAPPQERTCDNEKHSEGCECLKLFYPLYTLSDQNCYTLPDGSCASKKDCMHTPKKK